MNKLKKVSMLFLTALLGEQPGLDQIHPAQEKQQCRPQTPEPVFYASDEIYRRCTLKIFRGTAYLGYHIAVPEDLHKHLVVKHKIIRVLR